MKKILLTSIIIIATLFFVNAQISDTIYFDKNWNPTQSGKHKYYRVTQLSDSIVLIADYYNNGSIQMTGQLELTDSILAKLVNVDDFSGLETGLYTWYKPNGIKKYSTIYKPFEHHDLLEKFQVDTSLIAGSVKNELYYMVKYYSNGNIEEKYFAFDKCTYHGRGSGYMRNGDILRTIDYQYGLMDGKYILYVSEGEIMESIEYKMGVKHGETRKYDLEGKVKKIIVYDNGKLVKTIKPKKREDAISCD